MADVNTEKIAKYEEFINSTLKLDLREELMKRDTLFSNIANHSQLKQTLNCILEADLKNGLRMQVDLGSNLYSQAFIPDASKIYVKIGLDVHLEMTLQEAVKYCDKKIDILTQQVAESTKNSAKIKSKIRFFNLALQELQNLTFTSVEKQKSYLTAL